MKSVDQERIFLDKTRGVLKQDIERLNPAAVSRLRQMRRAALDRRDSTGMGLWKILRVPVAALAAVSVIILVTSLYFKSPVELRARDSIEDMEILASNDRLDMYMDLDFYEWLAWEQKNAG